MNLSRCEKGHFYDKEKYASCPHCAQGVQSDESLTTVFSESDELGVTEALDTPTVGMGVNPPIGAQSVQPSQPVEPVQPMQPMQPIQPVQPVQPIQPVAPAGDIMGAASNSIPQAGTMFTDTQAVEEEDDDHTMAFYDDIFASAPAAKPAAKANESSSVAPAAVSAPAKPARVNTPCVGWLIALKGEHVGQDFRLKVGKNFIGRGNDMDVVLDGEKSVSRNKHAIVVYEPKQHMYLVQPGESSELVYLNDSVVLNPMELKEYDVISIGEVSLLFMPLCSEKFNWTDVLKAEKQ